MHSSKTICSVTAVIITEADQMTKRSNHFNKVKVKTVDILKPQKKSTRFRGKLLKMAKVAFGVIVVIINTAIFILTVLTFLRNNSSEIVEFCMQKL